MLQINLNITVLYCTIKNIIIVIKINLHEH